MQTSDVHQQHVTPKPLLCTLEKKAPTDEFGFNLHAERGRGHFIGKVDESSIAHRSGLVLAQRIVGVNGTLIFPTTPHEVDSNWGVFVNELSN
jgi:predicted metalloprotease with PDZ domain